MIVDCCDLETLELTTLRNSDIFRVICTIKCHHSSAPTYEKVPKCGLAGPGTQTRPIGSPYISVMGVDPKLIDQCPVSIACTDSKNNVEWLPMVAPKFDIRL